MAEADGALIERLGPPEEYAAELRASAEIPPRGERGGRPVLERLAARVARSGPGRVARSLAATEAVSAIRAFLPELRPGWWVLRGYLAVVAVGIVWGEHPVYPLKGVLVPSVFGRLIGLALVGLAMWASVVLGRQAASSKGARRASAIVSVVVVLVAGVALDSLQNRVVPTESLSSEPSYSPFLQHEDGSPITNICPYAADGSPLSGVLLFDQSGRPIEELAPQEEAYAETGDEVAPQPSVAVLPNAYPRPQRISDPNSGIPMEFHCPQVVVGGTQPVDGPGPVP